MGDLIELHPKEVKTICVNCNFCNQQDSSLMWYEYSCHAPGFKRKEVLDPVTGRMKYLNPTDSVLADEAEPYCRDSNVNGKCKFFKPNEISRAD